MNLPDIPAAVREVKMRDRRQWPVRSNRASQLGGPCERQLVYWRTAWEQAELPDVGLQTIFDEGRLHEQAVLEDIRKAGFTIIEQQRPFDWPKYNITGHLDAKVLTDGVGVPVEVKSCSPYTWREITTVEDMLRHKYHYVRAWPSQMMLYLLLSNSEAGIMLLKNKSTGGLKQIEFRLDMEHAEELVAKAERINAHVAAGTIADRIPYDQDICGRCPFFSICLPDIALREAAEFWPDDPEIVTLLRRREELDPARAEYARTDGDAKELFKKAAEGRGNMQYLVAGEFLVQVSDRQVKAEARLRPARTDRVVKIQRLGKDRREAE